VKHSNADFYVVCFSVADAESREHVVTEWIDSIERYETCDAPIFVLGTKSDLVDAEAKKEAAAFVAQVASEKEGRVLGYYECSANQPRAEIKSFFIDMCRKSQLRAQEQAEFANKTDWPRHHHLHDPKCR